MKVIEIIGKNYIGTAAHTREACRGLVLQDGKLLLSHELFSGWYLIPGGGLEGDETPEECCVREMREETGYIVSPREHFLTLKEYYGDWCYISHYFRCEVAGQGSVSLTEQEKSRGLVPEWAEFEVARAIFAGHVNLTDYEEKRGSYQREDTALRIFRDTFA